MTPEDIKRAIGGVVAECNSLKEALRRANQERSYALKKYDALLQEYKDLRLAISKSRGELDTLLRRPVWKDIGEDITEDVVAPRPMPTGVPGPGHTKS